MMLLARRFLHDYARNVTNVLMLGVVPFVFVIVSADTMSNAARLLGGAGGGTGVSTVTAGWAAGFLAAVAMYFQVTSARAVDRRLSLAGLPRRRLVGARVLTGGLLAILASTAAVGALAVRGPLDEPARVLIGTALFASVYLAIGAAVGAIAPNPSTGMLVLLLAWIVDVFFGPALSASTSPVTRALPTHFVSLWMADLPSGHGGPSDWILALGWTAASLGVAYFVVSTATPRGGSGVASQPRGSFGGVALGLRLSWRGWRRTPSLWVLLLLVPVLFIWLADAVTPSGSTTVELVEAGIRSIRVVDPAHIHAATMAPVAVGSLSALAGVFLGLDARAADHRLVLAGENALVVAVTRVGLLMIVALVSTTSALGVVAIVFQPHQPWLYALSLGLTAATYALVGLVLGPIFGRVAGAYMAFLLPFLDLGIGQSPMLGGETPEWAAFVPGSGVVKVLLDGALTTSLDETGPLLQAVGWVVGLMLVFGFLQWRTTPATARRASAAGGGGHGHRR